MWFRDSLSLVGAVESCKRGVRSIRGGAGEGGGAGGRLLALTPACFVYDGKDPGYSPLITSNGDNMAPVISHTNSHTGKQH